MSDGVALSDVEFRLLIDLLHSEFGIHTPPDRRRFIEVKLSPRITRLGFRSFGEYIRHLRYKDPSGIELGKMISVITNPETYFFREDTQLSAFQQRILPEVKRRKLAAGTRSLSVFSAGCSSGEEVYTLAVLLLESGLFLNHWRLRVVGLDISEDALHFARRGVYYANAFRGGGGDRLRRYMRATETGAHEIKGTLRSLVAFERANLGCSSVRHALHGADIIFCRNVLIYFSQDRRKQAVTDFHAALAPGGYLFLGHSETLSGVFDEFEVIRQPGSIAYMKRSAPGTR